MKNKRDFCISSVRKILQEKHILFKEIEADSGSIYFKLYLGISTPCLRLADHPHGRRKPSVTIYWTVGENAKEKHIKNRIELTINKMIKNSKIGKVIGLLNEQTNHYRL